MNNVVLITGASTGFGRIAAETLAQRGFRVFATMRDSNGRNASHREALESLARTRGQDLHVVDLDVTRDESVNDAVEQILATAGRIDVVINNAGIAAIGVTEAYTLDDYRRLFDVNFFGVIRVNRAVLPGMRRQRSGLLIHVSSAAGRVVGPCMAVYCASKFALEALADAYRFELSPFGIDSVLVEPGMHKTPILEKFLGPEDERRAAEYGPDDYTTRIRAVFEAGNRAAETPGPEDVVDEFVRLIEMPAGERPFRTVPTLALQAMLNPYNEAAGEMRQAMAHMFGVPELLTMQRAAPVIG